MKRNQINDFSTSIDSADTVIATHNAFLNRVLKFTVLFPTQRHVKVKITGTFPKMAWLTFLLQCTQSINVKQENRWNKITIETIELKINRMVCIVLNMNHLPTASCLLFLLHIFYWYHISMLGPLCTRMLFNCWQMLLNC